MPNQKILTHPDARLRRKSALVTCFDDNLSGQFETLEQTMQSGSGGVGIAAPQVGENRRMIVVDCRGSRRPCKHHGLLYMANPHIEYGSGERLGREGCLSVPDWVGMVSRAAEIVVCYNDPDGAQQHVSANGFEARVIQHEIDHLDGILFIDKVISNKGLIRRLTT